MNLLNGAERLLVLAPHTDDGEFGCGGTIARFCEASREVFYVAFSSAEKSVPEGMPTDILRLEVLEATATLRIPRENLIVHSYPVRDFPAHRQAILEEMIKLDQEIRPDIVLLPSPNDTHQDHSTIAHEGFRAFKRRTMLGYEVPWNNLTFNTNCFVFLEDRHLKAKVDALRSYKSQSHRPYATEEFVTSLARTRGVQIGQQYAEVFEVIRWIIG